MIHGIAGIESFRLKVDVAMDSTEFPCPARQCPDFQTHALPATVLLSRCEPILHTDSQRAAAEAAFLIMG